MTTTEVMEQDDVQACIGSKLRGRVAFVTGGTTGHRCGHLPQPGQPGRRNCRWVRRAPGKCRVVRGSSSVRISSQAAVTVHRGNISSGEDCRRTVQEVIDQHGKLDILVNNAGITKDRTVLKMTDDEWRQVLDVNLSGTFFMAQAALRHMIERGSGRIVNVSSIVGEIGNIGQANYAASKSGLFGLTKTLAREAAFHLARAGKLDPDGLGITVNTVSPGAIATEMVAEIPEKVHGGPDGHASRWGVSAVQRRSPGWCTSSPPTPPPTSPVRCGASTAGWICELRGPAQARSHRVKTKYDDTAAPPATA